MTKVALTGGIATGKSHVLACLKERDVPVIDADEIVHRLFEAGTSVTNAIKAYFGDGFLHPDGSVDRSGVAKKVFSDADARTRLEAIVHPVVYETISSWFDTIDRPFGVASIPLLYETHREADFDLVVITACSAEQQIERLIQRGLTDAEARLRLAAQLPTSDKIERADIVIWTDGSTEETDRQVDRTLERLEGLPRSS